MSVLKTSRWFRRGLTAAALVATGALTIGVMPQHANAQAYPYYAAPYYGYYPYSAYYSAYRYPYYSPYYYGYPYAPVNVRVGGWGWHGGHWGWHGHR